MHKDFDIVKALYDQHGLSVTGLSEEPESFEYGACTYNLNGLVVKFRVSKITPKKAGQFVTIWKRNEQGITQPFDETDELDFVIISSRNGTDFGQFIFPKAVLVDKRIITGKGREGKRGIRVYPPWDKANNKQAIKTQEWQLRYFVDLQSGGSREAMRSKLHLKQVSS
ncbi:MAG: MepB family protein [Bacteroidota bacterium]